MEVRTIITKPLAAAESGAGRLGGLEGEGGFAALLQDLLAVTAAGGKQSGGEDVRDDPEAGEGCPVPAWPAGRGFSAQTFGRSEPKEADGGDLVQGPVTVPLYDLAGAGNVFPAPVGAAAVSYVPLRASGGLEGVLQKGPPRLEPAAPRGARTAAPGAPLGPEGAAGQSEGGTEAGALWAEAVGPYGEQVLKGLGGRTAETGMEEAVSRAFTPAEQLAGRLAGEIARRQAGENGTPYRITLKLWPRHLGDLTVKIEAAGSRINAQFYTSTVNAAGAVEASLRQLRELLAESGLELAGAGTWEVPVRPEFGLEDRPGAGKGGSLAPRGPQRPVRTAPAGSFPASGGLEGVPQEGPPRLEPAAGTFGRAESLPAGAGRDLPVGRAAVWPNPRAAVEAAVEPAGPGSLEPLAEACTAAPGAPIEPEGAAGQSEGGMEAGALWAEAVGPYGEQVLKGLGGRTAETGVEEAVSRAFTPAEQLAGEIARRQAGENGTPYRITLKLWPRHLGDLTVKIEAAGSRINAQFYTSTVNAAGAVEASLRQLRELLAESGLELAGTGTWEVPVRPEFGLEDRPGTGNGGSTRSMPDLAPQGPQRPVRTAPAGSFPASGGLEGVPQEGPPRLEPAAGTFGRAERLPAGAGRDLPVGRAAVWPNPRAAVEAAVEPAGPGSLEPLAEVHSYTGAENGVGFSEGPAPKAAVSGEKGLLARVAPPDGPVTEGSGRELSPVAPEKGAFEPAAPRGARTAAPGAPIEPEGAAGQSEGGTEAGALWAGAVGPYGEQVLKGLGGRTAETGAEAAVSRAFTPAEQLAGRLAGEIVRRRAGENGMVYRITLKLWPRHLGDLTVKIEAAGSRINAQFYTSTVNAAGAVEASLSQLRELLAESGLELAGTGVYVGQEGGSAQGKPAPGKYHRSGKVALPLRDLREHPAAGRGRETPGLVNYLV